MKEKAISGPMMELLAEIVRQGVPEERIRRLNESGLFSKILKANLTNVSKEAIARELGLLGPPSPIRIVRGYCESLSALREMVQKMECYIGRWGNGMLDRLGPEALPRYASRLEARTAIISGKDLGLPKRFTLRHVFERGESRGLQKCFSDDALALRVWYRLQPYGECIRVAMDPIPDHQDNDSIFRLECTDADGLLIDGMCGDLDREWDLNERIYWAFINPR